MGRGIDIVGHFGSRFSYATVTHEVCRGLVERHALGPNVTNMDGTFEDKLFAPGRKSRERGDAVLLISDPRDYVVSALVGQYGKDKTAIFVCPNTDSIDAVRSWACSLAGRIYTPSQWCADTVFREVTDCPSVEVRPLGCEERIFNGWANVDARPVPLRFLHVTTDGFWPGRKGTYELLEAWKQAGTVASQRLYPLATLTIHCMMGMHQTIHQTIHQMGLADCGVKVVSAPQRGSTFDDLSEVMSKHDVLIAPSRSEGFGIMPLSALCMGIPTMTTAGTGQDEYLGTLGGWLQIPTQGSAGLAGETGRAPVVNTKQLALLLVAMLEPSMRRALLGQMESNVEAREQWSWKVKRAEWAESLVKWSSGE